MKIKHYIIVGILLIVFGLLGYYSGLHAIDETQLELSLYSVFGDDVKEARQGRMAGAVIALTDNESLSEAWEELCSDIINDYGVSD